jgi:hypothetical protein
MVDAIYGYCDRCQAPVFVEVTLDAYAYKVHSYRCWNGHYKRIVVEHFSPMPRLQAEDNVVFLAPYLAARATAVRRRARR